MSLLAFSRSASMPRYDCSEAVMARLLLSRDDTCSCNRLFRSMRLADGVSMNGSVATILPPTAMCIYHTCLSSVGAVHVVESSGTAWSPRERARSSLLPSAKSCHEEISYTDASSIRQTSSTCPAPVTRPCAWNMSLSSVSMAVSERRHVTWLF